MAWHELPGRALQLSIGADGSMFMVDNRTAYSDGSDIWKWDGTKWNIFGGHAIQTAVSPTGAPWHMNQFGSMYAWVNGHWQAIPGKAYLATVNVGDGHPITLASLAIGANGTVCHVGTTSQGPGGNEIARWNGSGWDRLAGAAAVEVAVGPDGTVWHVNQMGDIYRGQHGTWQRLPGRAFQLAVGANGAAFHIGMDMHSNSPSGIYQWNGTSWDLFDSASDVFFVAVGPKGTPLYISMDNVIRAWS